MLNVSKCHGMKMDDISILKRKKILITGSAGFIGGSIVEQFYLSNIRNITAGIHQWKNAARIARFPVDIVICDVMDKKQLDNVIKNVDLVIHCAYGNKEVTVKGTENLMQIALENEIEKVVYISTVEVYGNVNGTINEEYPIEYSCNDYADMKVDAEKVCWKYIKKGLPIVILRPSIVYGPFSELWTVNMANRLISGNWGIFSGYGDGICNLVYIDDLVMAIRRALCDENSIGEAFNINGSEQISWNDYFSRLNKSLGLPKLKNIEKKKARLTSLSIMPLRRFAKYMLNNHGDIIMKMYSRFDLAKFFFKSGEKMIKSAPTLNELDLYNRQIAYSIEKAKNIIKYEPKNSVDEGIFLSSLWLKHHLF
ncbi:MAG: NAD-dependent epimerase/dehydratase family protein [Candidatus Helarchaeota archaeon]